MAAIGVQILGDSTSLERAFKRSEVAAAEFNGRMNALGQATRGAISATGGKGSFLFGSAAFIGASVGAGVLTKAAEAASDLNEQLSKSNVVFGKSAKAVSDWSQSTSTDIGIARRQALAAAATFGSVFVNTGRTKAQAAEFGTTLVNLAGDLASFNNASTDDALNALRSGLAGEIEPLRRFQVFLTEAGVAQEALAETGKKSVTQLTQGEKILARYNLILGQTTIQQGDYARTAGGVANQTRTLQANLDDTAAELGSTFLPALAAGLQGLNDFFAGLHKTIGGLRDFRDDLKDSHFADGFNSAVETATNKASDFFLSVRDGIPGLQKLKDLLGVPTTGKGIPPPLRPNSQEGHQTGATFQIVTPADADKQAKAFVKRFNSHMRGLQLKFDRAQLTKGFADDLAALNEQLVSIDAAEKKLGKTFDLEQQRVQVQGQIKTIQDQLGSQADKKLEARQKAIQKVLDGFDLKLSKAQLTTNLSDDLKILNQELAAVRKLQEANKNNADLKSTEVSLESQILDLKKQQTAETKAQFDAAKERADALFGTLFKAQDAAQRTLTVLGGSKGKQTVVLPGAGGGEDAKGLLSDLNVQIKSFKNLQANILELQRKGAPKSLIEAARSGEISADQIDALAHANTKTLNAIFKNVRLADKLVSRAARAEINAKDVNLHANTVTIRGTVNATSQEHGHGQDQHFTVHTTVNLDGKKVGQSLERHKKKGTQQTRGRNGGKR